jgi:hypothetical protein
MLGLPPLATFADAETTFAVAAIGAVEHCPGRSWLSTTGLAAANHAAHVLLQLPVQRARNA